MSKVKEQATRRFFKKDIVKSDLLKDGWVPNVVHGVLFGEIHSKGSVTFDTTGWDTPGCVTYGIHGVRKPGYDIAYFEAEEDGKVGRFPTYRLSILTRPSNFEDKVGLCLNIDN